MFVPPLHHDVPDLIDDLVLSLHNDNTGLPDLVKVAKAHYQFETIHPFLDGNGRTGRLLIVLYLIECGLLPEPLLYMSQYLEANRHTYYHLLHAVRTKGSLLDWLVFFLEGIVQTANHASAALQASRDLERKLIAEFSAYAAGKAAKYKKLLHFMFAKPVFNAKEMQAHQGITSPTANAMLSHLITLGYVTNYKDRKVNRYYVFAPLLELNR